MKLGISYVVFEGEELLGFAIRSIREHIDFVSVIYQTTSYFGNLCRPELLTTLQNLKKIGLIDELIHFEPDLGKRSRLNEVEVRNLGLQRSIEYGCTHHISADVDEFYLPEQLDFAKRTIMDHDCSVVSLHNYYKEPTFLILPHQKHLVSFIHPVTTKYEINDTFPYKIDITRRMTPSANCRLFNQDEFVVHHMTYVRKDIKIKLYNSPSGVSCDIDKFADNFNKYQLGERLRVAPDHMNRKTVLVENTFGIEI